MICRYRFSVASSVELSASRAYAFYSCLLSLLPNEFAVQIHEQGETPISQFLYFDRSVNKNIWQISVLGDSAVEAACPVLDELTSLDLNIGTVYLSRLEKRTFTAEEFILNARLTPVGRWTTLLVLSPAAFKQSGRYTILPQERLILQSLLNKWNLFFPDYPLDDEDAIKMLEDGMHISDYSLRSGRFPLKDHKIPGFLGSVTVEMRVSAPIMELWNLLVHFAEFSGVGIKTALGMGGIALKDNCFA